MGNGPSGVRWACTRRTWRSTRGLRISRAWRWRWSIWGTWRAQCEEGPAAALYDQALVLFRELGHERGVARALVRLSAKR